jgi:hypothetical protein
MCKQRYAEIELFTYLYCEIEIEQALPEHIQTA